MSFGQKLKCTLYNSLIHHKLTIILWIRHQPGNYVIVDFYQIIDDSYDEVYHSSLCFESYPAIIIEVKYVFNKSPSKIL